MTAFRIALVATGVVLFVTGATVILAHLGAGDDGVGARLVAGAIAVAVGGANLGTGLHGPSGRTGRLQLTVIALDAALLVAFVVSLEGLLG